MPVIGDSIRNSMLVVKLIEIIPTIWAGHEIK